MSHINPCVDNSLAMRSESTNVSSSSHSGDSPPGQCNVFNLKECKYARIERSHVWIYVHTHTGEVTEANDTLYGCITRRLLWQQICKSVEHEDEESRLANYVHGT